MLVKLAVEAAIASEQEKEVKPKIIFQLGTNNWQWDNEPAPGSGILHESHHNAFNSIDNTMSYSIYPSKLHSTKDVVNNDDDLIRIYGLNGRDLPICESAGPVSKRRWHAMSQQEVDEYRVGLEDMVYSYLIDIEKKHGKNCIYFCVAHHTFMNCVVLRNVMAKREKEHLDIPVCMVFCHGTGLKMYQNELREEKEFKDINDDEKDKEVKQREFPLKFYPWINELGLFSNTDKKGYINYLLAVSTKVIKQFQDLFPDFDKKKCILNYCGYNQNMFKIIPDLELNAVLKDVAFKSIVVDEEKVVESDYIIGSDVKYDNLVVFVGKLADWKRMDYVVAASEIYNENFTKMNKKVLTLFIGGGMKENQVAFLKLLKQLKNKNIFYIGPKMQPILCKIWNVTDVGVYPSKNEPFGMVFIETMACGTPVIGAKSGGPCDYIDDKVGILIEENDDKQIMINDIAKNVTEFIQNDFKTKKRNECLKRANTFDVIGMQQKLLRELEPLLK